MFFLVFFFQDGKTLDRIIDGKYNDYIYLDFLYSIFAIIFVSGLVSLFLKIIGSDHKYYKNINVVLNEIPKVFYVMGNSVGITAMPLSLEPVNDKAFNLEWFSEGLTIFVCYFLIGLIFSFLLNKNNPNSLGETHE
ncbi:hypothetical protein ACGTJS_00580 [Faucicola mancuniensis]|uniref:hypothetical protein n=1 Tax=Faucicola mancuniensis TaxID=1309795 RepID=UPI003977D80A